MRDDVPESPDVADPDLSKFQLRALAILAEEARYGLAVKQALAEFYGEPQNHGRLYPNLDTLAEKGYVEKSELDKRTNQYAITDAGRDVLAAELEWLAARTDQRVVDADHRLADAEPAVSGGDD